MEAKAKAKASAVREESSSRRYREAFGGNAHRPCLYCSLNVACFGCGASPLASAAKARREVKEAGNRSKERFEFVNKDGPKAGKPFAWSWRCSTALLRESDVHLCNRCGTRLVVYKAERVARTRDKQTKALANPENPRLAQRALADQNPFPPFVPTGGRYGGLTLQVKIIQNEKETWTMSPEECDPQKREVSIFLLREGNAPNVLLCSYTPGQGGAKRHNGQGKTNKALRQAKEEKEDEDDDHDWIAEGMAAAKEEERRKEQKDQVAYVNQHMAFREAQWDANEGLAYSKDLTVQEHLDFTDSAWQRARTTFLYETVPFLRSKLKARIARYASLQLYRQGILERQEDKLSYAGRVIDIESILNDAERRESKSIWASGSSAGRISNVKIGRCSKLKSLKEIQDDRVYDLALKRSRERTAQALAKRQKLSLCLRPSLRPPGPPADPPPQAL